MAVDGVLPNCFSLHLRWCDCLRFSSCSEQSLKTEDVTFSLNALPLFIGIIVMIYNICLF